MTRTGPGVILASYISDDECDTSGAPGEPIPEMRGRMRSVANRGAPPSSVLSRLPNSREPSPSTLLSDPTLRGNQGETLLALNDLPMADKEHRNRPDDTESDAPIVRLVACILIFGVWTVAVSVAHAVWPLRIDLISVVLAEVAIAPVLIFLFQHIEAGFGDWKFALRPYKVRSAFAKLDSLIVQHENVVRVASVDASATLSTAGTLNALKVSGSAEQNETSEPTSATTLDTAPDDVVFVRLRREIQKRLSNVADAHGIKDARFRFSAMRLLDELKRRQIIGPDEARGLKDLIAAGNAQSHGLPTSPDIADYARDEGDRLLAALENLAIQPEVALLNAVIEKAGPLDEPLEYMRYGVDLTLPGEVAFEVKAGLTSSLVESASLATLRRLVESKIVKAGILVLSNKPEGVEDGQDLKSEFSLGFAWMEGDGFAGDALARRFAPWLFQ